MADIRRKQAIGMGIDDGANQLSFDSLSAPDPRGMFRGNRGLISPVVTIGMKQAGNNPEDGAGYISDEISNHNTLLNSKGYALTNRASGSRVASPSAPPPSYQQTYDYRHNPFPGASLVLTAMRWSGFYSGSYGPEEQFPMHMPGTNPGFIAKLYWDVQTLFPPYSHGVVFIEIYADVIGFGRGINVTSGGSTIFVPPLQDLAFLTAAMDSGDLGLINTGGYTGIGSTQGADSALNTLYKVKVGLYK